MSSQLKVKARKNYKTQNMYVIKVYNDMGGV